MAPLTHFECAKCGEKLSAAEPQTVCPKDGGSLYARYDLRALRGKFTPASLAERSESAAAQSSPRKTLAKTSVEKTGFPGTMWRYREVLPDVSPVSLGEGFTPMIRSRKRAKVFIKDEGLNPTGSFKARGLCAAVTMAKAYGLKKLAIPSAGNAASALAAYAAAAGIEAHIFMPQDVPTANLVECNAYGAKVTLVNGLITDCGRMVAERKEKEGWFDVSTLKEPFRIEGKKTMGYEVAEQLGWKLPDAIIYPTGGGVGMIGMWKAFDEMEELGWFGSERPKMVSVQSAGCAPIPKAFDEGKKTSESWPHASTIAAGLRVPKAYGDYIILDILRKSAGAAVAVTDDEILAALREWAQEEGVFAAPEGAASLAAYLKLRASGFLKESDTVVLFNTGSGIKYVDVLAKSLPHRAPQPSSASVAVAEPSASRPIGGIIGPY